jgi:hypothetical protein
VTEPTFFVSRQGGEQQGGRREMISQEQRAPRHERASRERVRNAGRKERTGNAVTEKLGNAGTEGAGSARRGSAGHAGGGMEDKVRPLPEEAAHTATSGGVGSSEPRALRRSWERHLIGAV